VTRTRAPLWFAISLAIIAVIWILYPFIAPDTPQTTLQPTTDLGFSTHRPYTLIFWITAVVFVLVEGILVYALFRYRRRSDELPPQIHGHTGLEVGWTVATVLLVLVMFVPSCQEIHFAQAKPPEGALRVEVNGKQWWWEIYYPEYDIVTANEVRLPAGRTVAFDLTSTDVIHSLWVPRLGGKRDLVPGRHQILWFTPPEPGVFAGQCAEYCGTSHANMALETIVMEPAEFEAWVQQQKAPSPPSADPLVQQGQVAFLTTAACITCHMPLQNDGNVRGLNGPNLRKVGTRRTLASGMFDNTPENLSSWIKDPQGMKPGALMNVPHVECTGEGTPKACCTGPATGNCLSDETVEQLVAYLGSLK
jgi:cytochrome c oxidase subunit 2